jgi:hypothetical protein
MPDHGPAYRAATLLSLTLFSESLYGYPYEVVMEWIVGSVENT